MQLDFKLEGATTFHVGFDPAPGQLKRPGLVFRAGGKRGQEVAIDNVKV